MLCDINKKILLIFEAALNRGFNVVPINLNYTHMLFKFFALIVMIGASQLAAKAPLEVSKVDFNTTKDDWIQMQVELHFGDNLLPDARSKDFFSKIGVTVYLAYEIDAANRQYDYYRSKVKIALAEAKEKYNVYFYLPGMIVERDRISKAKPEYYYVALDIAGNELPPKQNSYAISDSIKNLQILNSFISKAKEMSASTKGLLMPSYYAPGAYKSRVQKQPLYLRLDPESAQ